MANRWPHWGSYPSAEVQSAYSTDPTDRVEKTNRINDENTRNRKLDISNGYWHIPVDKECSKLSTFNSPFGRYSFCRLPYGIHSDPENVQPQIAKIIEGIEETKKLPRRCINLVGNVGTPHREIKESLQQIK